MVKLWKRLVHWLLWKKVSGTAVSILGSKTSVPTGEWTASPTASPSDYTYTWEQRRRFWRRWS